MPHSTNTLRLREIMRENSLTPLDVAEILNRSYQTVLIWRSVNDQDIPDNLLPQAGHDFWLTRNGHGPGFWDRPEIYGEEKAQELSALAETFGVVDLYVGDDGRIYG